MFRIALVILLLLAIGGCVCVVWAARGGPAWVRAVAQVTIAVGKGVGRTGKRQRSNGGDNGGTTSGD